MLLRSQPLAPEFSEKYKLDNKREFEEMQECNIESQRIGEMFDDILDDAEKRKISLKTRLSWNLRRAKDSFYDFKHTAHNHIKWHKTMRELRPWEGFSGLVEVMLTHLRDYVQTEEQYGHSAEEYKNQKIASAKESIQLLVRLKEPDECPCRRQDEVNTKYPKYKQLITKYKIGGTSCSGDFVPQGSGWFGKESGG